MASPQLNNTGLLVELTQTLQLVRCRIVLALLQSRSTSVRNRIAALKDGPESEAAREILKKSSDELDARMEVLRQHSALATAALERCSEDLDVQATALDTRCEDLRKLHIARAINPAAFYSMLLLTRIRLFAIKGRSEVLHGVLRPVAETLQHVQAASAAAARKGFVPSKEGFLVPFRNVFVRTNSVIAAVVFVFAAWFYTKGPPESVFVASVLALLTFVFCVLLPVTLAIIGAYRAQKARASVFWPAFSGIAPYIFFIAGGLLGMLFVEKAYVAADRGLMLLDRPQVSGAAAYLTMPNGAQVEVLEKRSQWFRVRYGTQVGWTSAQFLIAKRPESSGAADLQTSGTHGQTQFSTEAYNVYLTEQTNIVAINRTERRLELVADIVCATTDQFETVCGLERDAYGRLGANCKQVRRNPPQVLLSERFKLEPVAQGRTTLGRPGYGWYDRCFISAVRVENSGWANH